MTPLHVHVGDVIKQGEGNHAHIVHITWPSNATPEHPIAEAITFVPPVGSGAISGTALNRDFLRYVGFDSDDGHTWEVTVDGYQLVTQPWWETFRYEPTTPQPRIHTPTPQTKSPNQSLDNNAKSSHPPTPADPP